MAESEPAQSEPHERRLEEPAGISYLRNRLANTPVTELVRAGPRAAGFLARSAGRNLRSGLHRHPEIPTRLPGLGTAAAVLIDELMLAFMATTRLSLTDDDLDRISAETDEAIARFEAEGIFAEPARLHPEPPAAEVTIEPRAYRGIRYDHVVFESGYHPAIDLPGTERWRSIATNVDAHAYVLRHREPRPWLVNVHGFGMGGRTDVIALRALHFHRDLGLNVIQPVFPVHGPRSAGPAGEQAFTIDYLNNVHSLSQAVWDIRRIMAWARTEAGAESFAVHGISMGGYTASLLAGLVDGLDCVIAGVPTVDLAWVMRRHVPEEERTPLDTRDLLGDRATRVHQPVSPLSFEPRVPADRRFVYAGIADRMATPGQAHRLWKHWDEPTVCWYRGSHVGFTWSREVRTFVDDALIASGVVGNRTT